MLFTDFVDPGCGRGGKQAKLRSVEEIHILGKTFCDHRLYDYTVETRKAEINYISGMESIFWMVLVGGINVSLIFNSI